MKKSLLCWFSLLLPILCFADNDVYKPCTYVIYNNYAKTGVTFAQRGGGASVGNLAILLCDKWDSTDKAVQSICKFDPVNVFVVHPSDPRSCRYPNGARIKIAFQQPGAPGRPGNKRYYRSKQSISQAKSKKELYFPRDFEPVNNT